jgi:L-asparagine oxygenase
MDSIRHYSLDSKHAQSVQSIIKNMRTPTSQEELLSSYENSFGMTFIDHVVVDEAMNFGVPFSFAHEQDGAIVQNIFPIKKFADEQISSSSNAELQLHTEVAFHNSRPDILLLFCVRADEEAGTTFAELREILRCIPQWVIEQLKQPEFLFHPDLSFTMNGASTEPLVQSVFADDLSEMTYDYTAVEPITSHAGVALDFLNRAINHCKKTIYLRQGEFLAIPNRRTVHGRTNYTPRFDGQDRWLKRVIAAHPERCLTDKDICLNPSPVTI